MDRAKKNKIFPSAGGSTLQVSNSNHRVSNGNQKVRHESVEGVPSRSLQKSSSPLKHRLSISLTHQEATAQRRRASHLEEAADVITNRVSKTLNVGTKKLMRGLVADDTLETQSAQKETLEKFAIVQGEKEAIEGELLELTQGLVHFKPRPGSAQGVMRKSHLLKLHNLQGDESHPLAFKESYDIMVGDWKLFVPSLVMHILDHQSSELLDSGSGDPEVNIPIAAHQYLKLGLQTCASTIPTWVVTSGLNSPTNKLIQSIMPSSDTEGLSLRYPPPLIGVSSQFADWHKLQMTRAPSASHMTNKWVEYTCPFTSSMESLAREHHSFICFDEGEDRIPSGINMQGIKFCAALREGDGCEGVFQTMSSKKNALSLVVGGSVALLPDILASIRSNTPVVVIQGTGGLADIIAKVSKTHHGVHPHNQTPNSHPSSLSHSRISKRLLPSARRRKSSYNIVYDEKYLGEAVLRDIESVVDSPMLVVHSPEQGGFEDAVFQALLCKETYDEIPENATDELRDVCLRRLELCLLWHRIDYGEIEMNNYILVRDKNDPIYDLFLWAMKFDRNEFVYKFIEIGLIDLRRFMLLTTDLEAHARHLKSLNPLKLDIDGYYGNVEWEYIETVSEHLHECISSASVMRGWSYTPQGVSIEDKLSCKLVPYSALSATHRADIEVEVVALLGVLGRLGYHVTLPVNKPAHKLERDVLPDNLKVQLDAHGRKVFRPRPFRIDLHDAEHAARGEVFSSPLGVQTVHLLRTYVHQRWIARRRLEGWTHGPFNAEKKHHPAIREFDDLRVDSYYEQERQSRASLIVNQFIACLLALGFHFHPPNMLQHLYLHTSYGQRYEYRTVLFKDNCSLDNITATIKSLICFKHKRVDVTQALDRYNLHAVRKSLEDNDLQPHFHLMLWAIITNNPELAFYFWKTGEDFFARALTAARLFTSIVSYFEKKAKGEYLIFPETKASFIDNSFKYKNIAYELLDKANHQDSVLISSILRTEHPYVGGLNSITLAYLADAYHVIEHIAFKSEISAEWKYGLFRKKARTKNIFIAALLLFMAPFIIPLKTPRRGQSLGKSLAKYFHKKKDDELPSEPEESYFAYAIRFYKTFLNAPITAYCYDIISWFLMLAFMSYVTILPYRTSSEPLEWSEWVLFFLMLSFTADEIRQIAVGGWRPWSRNRWNRIDAGIYCIYGVSFFLRLFLVNGYPSKIINCMVCFLVYLRATRLYSKSQLLGPKLLMIFEMTGDVIIFIALVGVILVPFGISCYTLVYPTAPLDFQTFVGIFYRPYFQIYGELFLEDIQSESDCFGQFPFLSCGSGTAKLVPLLLAPYLVFTNILLINLLIAMMNDTYQKLAGKHRRVWAHQNFELLYEYQNTHYILALPHPICLLGNLYLFFRHLYRMQRGLELTTIAEEQTHHFFVSGTELEIQRTFEKRHMVQLLKQGKFDNLADDDPHSDDSPKSAATVAGEDRSEEVLSQLAELKTLVLQQQSLINKLLLDKKGAQGPSAPTPQPVVAGRSPPLVSVSTEQEPKDKTTRRGHSLDDDDDDDEEDLFTSV